MHYYKKNIGDYAKKAGRLSMLQHGAYTLLIDSCYDRERFPTKEEAIDWTWASTSEEVEAVEFVLSRFFTLKDGVYVQQRIEQEINAYHEKAATNKRIAIERETNRKEKSTKRARGVNEAPPNHKPLTINHKPLTTNQEPLVILNNMSAKADDIVNEVFGYWKNVMSKGSNTLLTKKRKKLISDRLKDGYEIQDFKQAIFNCSQSSFHMGDNGNKTKYNDIELICRPDKFEQFRDNVGQQSIQKQLSSTTEKTISNIIDTELE